MKTARLETLKNEATFKNGVMRWATNSRVPFPDVINEACAYGLPVDAEACRVARALDNARTLRAYAERQAAEDDAAERAFERRAAFGPGVDVVDVFTGERYRT